MWSLAGEDYSISLVGSDTVGTVKEKDPNQPQTKKPQICMLWSEHSNSSGKLFVEQGVG